MRRAAVLAIALAACGAAEFDLQPGDPYPGRPFWEPVDLSGAEDRGHVVTELPEAERVAAGPVALTDVTVEAGLGAAIGGGNPHGVGVGFVDLDGDSFPDIVIANGVSGLDRFDSSHWRNNGDGTFTDVTDSAGVGAALAGLDTYAVAAADYDADGDVDLYISAQPTDLLLANNGDGTFVDVTAEAGAGGPPSDPELVRDGRSKISAWGDFNADGVLDVATASSTLPAPGAYLLLGNGDGTFRDATAESGIAISPIGNPCAVLWSDYDNDGDQDLWIWNDRGDKVLLRNQNRAAFEDVTFTSVGTVIRHPMGIDAADIDHDTDLDYYISNGGDNPLLENQGDGTFVDITRQAGTGGTFGWGLAFEDFNHDTWADIFVAQEDDLPHLTFTHRGVVPARFDEQQHDHIPVERTSRAHNVAAGFADYDRDGRTDVLVATTDGSRVTLYRNTSDVGTNSYIEIGVARGVGARVGIKTGDLIQFRDVTGGSSRASTNDLTVRFGLGPYDGVDYIYALWPDGRTAALTNVAGNQRVDL